MPNTDIKMDFAEQLMKVFKTALTYKGCRIEYFKNEFWVFGKSHSSLQDAKDRVDEAKKHLSNSIKK